MRKLASVQVVEELSPIAGADRIELARVLGWKVIVKKGEFKVGHVGVFFEVDSILPDAEWAAFLGERKRLRTMKMRGVLSQGLMLPPYILGPLPTSDLHVGLEVTALLGVTQYEPPAPRMFSGSGGVDENYAGPFPFYVPKTDEPRIQSEPGLLRDLEGHPWEATLKLDGTSATFLYDREGNFTVCSRNRAVKEGDNLYWRIARKYKIDSALIGVLGIQPLAIQGEIVGPGIQGNPMCLAEPQLYVFSIYNYGKGEYMAPFAMKQMCREMGLTSVPIYYTGSQFSYSIESLLEMAKGKYPNTNRDREGLVIRSWEPIPGLSERISFKVINNDYLLKER